MLNQKFGYLRTESFVHLNLLLGNGSVVGHTFEITNHMKNIIHLFVLILTIVGCSKNVYRITKIEDVNDVIEDQLFSGNVKEVTLFKVHIIDSITQSSQKIINSITTYTQFGKIKEKKVFDKFGKLVLHIKNDYNSENKLIKFLSNNSSFGINSNNLIEYDSIGNRKSRISIWNDTIEFKYLFKHDSIGNLTEEIEIKDDDTSSIKNIEYKYNNKNKVLWRKSIKKEKYYSSEEEHQMKYDKFGNLKEVIDKSGMYKIFGELRTSFEFDKQKRIIKLSQYKYGKLDFEILFDKTNNLVQIKYYKETKLFKELKYDYKSDKHGNWIRKYTYSKDLLKGEKQFVPLYVEERQIKYYK